MDTTQTTKRIERRPRRRRSRKPILGPLPRLIILLLVLGLVVSVFVPMGRWWQRRYTMNGVESRQIVSAQSKLTVLQSQNAQLQRERDYLRRADGIEVAARTQGYLRPGELRLVLETPPAPAPPPASSFTDRVRTTWRRMTGQ